MVSPYLQSILADLNNSKFVIRKTPTDPVRHNLERKRNSDIPLKGECLPQAGFYDGMPIAIRVMPGCIVITPQYTCEPWGCLGGMGMVGINTA
ncbi:MAG: SymE family type I addiction module toxin [Scandinavium sp.]|uniref:SymE family type I addiction module toxin n=1 Tax=Scandinavium sp. TaxID=2830653 RepID=UPI003F3E6DDB